MSFDRSNIIIVPTTLLTAPKRVSAAPRSADLEEAEATTRL